MSAPRIPPASESEMGEANAEVSRLFAERLGVPGLPNVFTTLARLGPLFAPYMDFTVRLMPDGSLPRDVTELLILRSAVNTDCAYEWHHHRGIGLRVGLTAEEIERVRVGAEADGWSAERRWVLRAADELHADHRLGDATWEALRSRFSDEQVMELCLLVGNYTMLAMLLNTVQVQIEVGG